MMTAARTRSWRRGLSIVLRLALVLFATTYAARATTYHVRTDGSDGKCDGRTDSVVDESRHCAYATLQRCARSLDRGDACLVHAGSYDVCPPTRVPLIGAEREAHVVIAEKHGTADSPIVLRGAGDGPVILEAGDTGGGNRCDYAIFVDESDHVVIGGNGANEGFTIRGDFDHNEGDGEKPGFYDGGTISIERSRHVAIIGNTLEGSTHASLSDRNAEIRIFGSLTGHELAYNRVTWRRARSAVEIIGGQRCCDASGGCPEPDGLTVHHNRFVWDPDTAYRIFGVLMRGCRDCAIYDNQFQCGDPSHYSEAGLCLYIRDDVGARIYNNEIHAFGSASRRGNAFGIYFLEACPFQEGRTRDVISSEGHRVYNNTIYGAARAAIRLNAMQDTRVRNNLVYGYAENAWSLGIGGEGFSGEAGYNAFHNVSAPWPDGRSCAAALGADSCDLETTNVYADPQVDLDPAGGPLRPRSGSPLIDAGLLDEDAPKLDLRDRPRVGRPDIGANESEAAVAPAQPPSSIRNLRAAPLGPTSVGLTWTDPTDGPGADRGGWDVRRAIRPIASVADFEAAESAAGTAVREHDGSLRLEVGGLVPRTLYYFALRRSGPGGRGELSNEASANTRFPGYGCATSGGSGGDVYHVSSLADGGPGSLRAGILEGRDGPRTIVFDVGGTITLLSDIRVRSSLGTDRLTIDGSTAPSPGITIRKQACPADLTACPVGAPCLTDGEFKIGGGDASATTDVLLTHLRFQGNYRLDWGACRENGGATLGLQHHFRNVVLDHLTIRNSSDAGPDLWTGSSDSSDVSILSSLIVFSNHPLTISDAGSGSRSRLTLYRNVLARSGERLPQVRGATDDLDFRNNVVFDWAANGSGDYGMRIRSGVAGERPNLNVVNNVFLAGNGRPRNAFYYGNAPGSGSAAGDDGGPPDCTTEDRCAACGAQGSIVTDSAMGQLWVSGNLFPPAVCEKFSTVAAERRVPENARVVTDDPADLRDTVLRSVGTRHRTPDEQALIDEIDAAIRQRLTDEASSQ